MDCPCLVCSVSAVSGINLRCVLPQYESPTTVVASTCSVGWYYGQLRACSDLYAAFLRLSLNLGTFGTSHLSIV